MLEDLVNIDKQLFIFLNGLHAAFIDPFMVFMSWIPVWVPLYAAIIFFFFWKRHWKIGLLALIGLSVTFALTDQLGVHLFKNTIQRLRPCHEPALQNMIYLLEGCGGQFSFISNHAANTFGLAIFTSLFFQKKWFSWSIFIWASLVSYSRIYVGKHYPLDIICGAAFGILIGYGIYRICEHLQKKFLNPVKS